MPSWTRTRCLLATARKPAKNTCKLSCCQVSEERKAEIRASAEATRGRSMFDPADGVTDDLDRFHGAQCRCGVPRKPPGISRHVNDDGLCVVHPEVPPQKWVRGAGR